MTITATQAKALVEAETGSPRYKAVRRVKNVSKTHIQNRINQHIRHIASAKDKQKIAVLQGKIDALNFALQVVSEA